MNGSAFAERLKTLRKDKGLTQEELAKKSGLSRAGIRDLELSLRKPAWETVLALADALGVECTAFLDKPADEKKPAKKKPGK